jgi:hypothetical protein
VARCDGIGSDACCVALWCGVQSVRRLALAVANARECRCAVTVCVEVSLRVTASHCAQVSVASHRYPQSCQLITALICNIAITCALLSDVSLRVIPLNCASLRVIPLNCASLRVIPLNCASLRVTACHSAQLRVTPRH